MLTTKMMTEIREKSDREAANEWFGADGRAEQLKATWRTLDAYKAYRASCALRDADAAGRKPKR